MRSGTSMALLVTLAMVVTPATLPAQGDMQSAVVVELTFKEDSVEFVGKTEKEAFVPRQYGTPQLEPLFFEALGPNGAVVYAGALADPRQLHVDSGPPSDPDEPPGEMILLKEATLRIAIPLAARAREIVVYRRTDTEDFEKGRTVLVRSGL